MTAVDERANGTRIEVRAGTEMELRLDENPTTGYRWRLDRAGAPQLALVEERYEAPAAGAVGAAGHHLFRFVAAAPGNAKLQLTYVRRFGTATRTFAVTVDVVSR